MTTHTFTGPKVVSERVGKCPTCGKTTRRSRTFEGTVNPYNTREDGKPKTWQEVRDDVTAKADAWLPRDEVFEHAQCHADRNAPQPAGIVELSTERVADAAKFRDTVSRVMAWLSTTTLPVNHIKIGAGVVDVGYADVDLIPRWARALGVDPVPVCNDGWCLSVRLRAEVDGLVWRVRSHIAKPDTGDWLPGAHVEWARNRNGRTTGGAVTVDELTTGLLRLGIAVVEVPATSEPGAS